MVAKWSDVSKTYNCFIKLSKKSETLTLFTVDTGASFTTLGAQVLDKCGLLSCQDEYGIIKYFEYMGCFPKQFVNASNIPNFRYLCCIDNITIGDIVFEKFYFFLDPKSTDIALLGNDVLHNCKFGSTNSGNMLVKDLNYRKYIETIEAVINTEGIKPYHINALFSDLDKQQEGIRNTASSFRELYKSRKDD